MRDNIQPWILKQIIESIPWCSEIQTQELRRPSIFISIPYDAQVWSLNQFLHPFFVQKEIKEKTFFSSFNCTYVLTVQTVTLFNNAY